jgi:outer membrane protein TolC
MSLQADAARVEQRLARNRRSPKIDLEALVAKDLGRVDPVDQVLLPAELVTGISVEFPLPLRQGRGELRKAEAEVGRIAAEQRFLRDTIATEVREAHAGLVAAHARVALARAQVEAARALAELERTRFERGDGTLLFVNLREQAAADAALLELEALAEYHRAAADLRAATGLRAG